MLDFLYYLLIHILFYAKLGEELKTMKSFLFY